MTTHKPENLWKVYLNGVYQPTLAATKVSRVIGGRAVQSAVFTTNTEATTTGKQQASIHQDYDARQLFAPDAGSPIVAISRGRADGSEDIVHMGRLVAVKLDLNQQGETLTYTSRLDHHLVSDIGLPISRTKWNNYLYSPTDFDSSWEANESDLEVVLNPIIDGVPRKNLVRVGTDDTDIVPSPFDIDSTPTDWVNAAKIPTGATTNVKWWSLADAVQYLLDNYNGDEAYIENPTRTELVAQLGTDESLIRNFAIKRGQYIPQILDKLLDPLGYSWTYVYPALPTGKPKFYFWKRNSPFTSTTVPLQRFGETVDINYLEANRTEAETYTLAYDAYSRSCEQVVAYGALEEAEATFELVPAWDPALDDSVPEELVEGKAFMDGDPKLRRVFRDWVLNEGGDYIEYSEHANRGALSAYYPGMNTRFDFKPIFNTTDDQMAVRRRFKKTITIDGDKKGSSAGRHNGCRVEYWDPDKPGGADWMLLEDNVQLLEDECGIRIGDSGQAPLTIASKFRPDETSLTNTVRVRITATVQSDYRVTYSTPFDKDDIPSNPPTLAKGKKLMIDLGSKYKQRTVDDASYYFGKLGYEARTADSLPDVTDIADHTLETWNASTCGGQIVLFGTDNMGQYLGWEVQSLQDRNIFITASNALKVGKEINPTVVALSYDVLANRTVLSLEVIRRDLRTL